MHELSITQGIIEMIADRVGDRQVSTVTLTIGQVSGVSPDAVRFCFGLVADGTVVQGAELRIETPPGRGRCHDCGRGDVAFDTPFPLCACGSTDVRVTAGDELTVTSVELRPADGLAPVAGGQTCA